MPAPYDNPYDTPDDNPYDLVVSGGLLVDGTGAPPVPGDLAVRDGRIAQLAAPGTLAGSTTIDARGRVVCPGFIDLHSHADFTVTGHPAADTAVAQGVTTLVTGNCGFSPFPVTDLARLQTATAFLSTELDWSWRDAAGYADAVDASEPAVNLALQVGHSSLRLAAMGAADRPPDTAERKLMAALLHEAADQGVYGFSTGLVYAPGCYADPAEVTELVRIAAERGLLYSTHMRNENDRLIEAVREAVASVRATGARLQISHLKAMGRANHGTVGRALALLDEAAADGLDVACDVYPYTASSTTLTAWMPEWSLADGRLAERLADPGTRGKIAAEVRERMGRDIDPHRMVVADLPDGPYRDAVGSSLDEVGRRLGVDATDAALELLAGHACAVAVVNHAISERDMVEVLTHPRASVASDGWVLRGTGESRPHPRSFGTFTRVLRRHVRELGELSLAEAVRKMTSLPAARLGLNDRGVLAAGAVADLAVFDPGAVADRSTFEEPWRLSTGVDHVLVAGQPVLRDGVPTGARPGRVLRRS